MKVESFLDVRVNISPLDVRSPHIFNSIQFNSPCCFTLVWCRMVWYRALIPFTQRQRQRQRNYPLSSFLPETYLILLILILSTLLYLGSQKMPSSHFLYLPPPPCSPMQRTEGRMSEVDLIKKRLLPNSIRIPLIKAIIEAAVSYSTSFENILI